MAEQYFLGIDAGQTVVKAVLHDSSLTQIAIARGLSPTTSPGARKVERSQDELFEAARDAIKRVLAESGVAPHKIAAIGLTGHGDGLHLVDAEGAPVGPAITAVDSRAWKEMDEILTDEDRSESILSRSGQVPFLGSTGVILRWMATHAPEFLEKADAMLFCKDVLRLRLTGEIGTDYSDAAASFLDAKQATWSTDVMRDYRLEDFVHLLPPLHLSSEVVGQVSAEAAALTGLHPGTPVVAGSHDVHASAIGMGSLEEGMLTLIAGSFSINSVATSQFHTDVRWQSRMSVEPGLRMAMSTSATASTTLEWFFKQVGVSTAAARNQLFSQAAEIAPRVDLPFLTPYLFASPFGQEPSGAFLGLRSWHTPAHLLLATLEGIVWMHIWHVSALAEAFKWPGGVRLGGGLANSPLYSQMVANGLNEVVEVVDNEETGSFGAAVLAATGAGVFTHHTEAKAFVEVNRVHEPQPDAVDYWTIRKQLFLDVHQSLEPVWASWPRVD